MTASSSRHDAATASPPDDMAVRIRSLVADPRFDAVLGLAIADILAFHRDRGWLARIFADRGHAIGSAAAVYLHYVTRMPGEEPGLTVGRFQALCAEMGFCSPGRASALLSLMRLARFLKPGEPGADRRIRLLQPTEKLLDIQWQRWSCFLPGAALALNVPARDLVERLERTQEPIAVMARRAGRRFMEGFRLLRYAPELVPMAERDGGIQVLSLLYAAGLTAGAEPDSRKPTSVSAIAASLGVSRAHVRKLLHAATEAGLLVRTEGAELLAPSATLVVALRQFYATVFILLADAACDVVPVRAHSWR